MLGIARERNGQMAHAKAEYEEYLRRYPEGPAADRIRSRLKAIRQSTAPGRAFSRRIVSRDSPALAAVCSGYAQCRWDGGAAFGVTFTTSDVSTRDYFHPTLAGQYLAAAGGYGSLYGKSVVGNPYDYFGALDKDTKEFVQKVADETVRKFFGR